jgi:mRNA interferase YafQ
LRNPISGALFRRDVKLAQKRGKDMAKLRQVILLLFEGGILPGKVAGPSTGRRLEAFSRLPHRADWLLIYQIDGEDLHLVRTGTHSDLF